MNYEELYGSLQNLEKELKDKQSAAQKQYKNAVKNTEAGDIKSLSKNLEMLAALLSEQKNIVEVILPDSFWRSAEKRESMCRGNTRPMKCFPIR